MTDITTLVKEAEVSYDPNKKRSAAIPRAALPGSPVDANKALVTLTAELAEATTALERTAVLKRIEKAAAAASAKLKPEAGLEFRTRKLEEPDKKQFFIRGCTFKSFSPAAKYTFSEVLEDKIKRHAALGSEIAADKASEKAAGTAIKKEAAESAGGTVFSVSVVA